MKSLLSEILNEIISGYKKLMATSSGDDSEKTRDTATNRLRFVLMQDRTNLSPEVMEKMRDELLEVISKYVVVDEELLDLNLASEGDAIALLASIPILRAKTKEEREETLRALEKKRQEELEALEAGGSDEDEVLCAEDIDAETLEDEQEKAFEEKDEEEVEELLVEEAESSEEK